MTLVGSDRELILTIADQGRRLRPGGEFARGRDSGSPAWRSGSAWFGGTLSVDSGAGPRHDGHGPRTGESGTNHEEAAGLARRRSPDPRRGSAGSAGAGIRSGGDRLRRQGAGPRPRWNFGLMSSSPTSACHRSTASTPSRRSARRGSACRVVFLTMQSDVSYARRAMAAGAFGYVLKHSAHDELVRAIREALRGRTYVSPMIAGELLRSYREEGPKHDDAAPAVDAATAGSLAALRRGTVGQGDRKPPGDLIADRGIPQGSRHEGARDPGQRPSSFITPSGTASSPSDGRPRCAMRNRPPVVLRVASHLASSQDDRLEPGHPTWHQASHGRGSLRRCSQATLRDVASPDVSPRMKLSMNIRVRMHYASEVSCGERAGVRRRREAGRHHETGQVAS